MKNFQNKVLSKKALTNFNGGTDQKPDKNSSYCLLAKAGKDCGSAHHTRIYNTYCK